MPRHLTGTFSFHGVLVQSSTVATLCEHSRIQALGYYSLSKNVSGGYALVLVNRGSDSRLFFNVLVAGKFFPRVLPWFPETDCKSIAWPSSLA